MAEQSKPELPPVFRRMVVYVAIVAVATLAVVWVAGRLRTLIYMLIVSTFVSFALEPAVQFLAKRRWRRGAATGFVFLLAVVSTAAFGAALAPLFVKEAVAVLGSLPDYLKRAEELIGRIVPVNLVDPKVLAQIASLENLLQSYTGNLAGNLLGVGTAVFGFIFRFVTIALFTFYMVADGPKLRRTVVGAFPQHRQREVLDVWEVAIEKTGAYVYSRMLLGGIAATATAGFLGIIGVPNAIALGIWVGVFSQFVPVVGTYIAAVLPVLAALGQSPATAFWVLAFLVGYQQVENYVLAPKISSRTMAIHPAVSVGAVIAGASLMGAMGAVLALPVAAIVQALISTYIDRHELVESELFREAPPRGVDPGKRREASADGAPAPEGDGVEHAGATELDG